MGELSTGLGRTGGEREHSGPGDQKTPPPLKAPHSFAHSFNALLQGTHYRSRLVLVSGGQRTPSKTLFWAARSFHSWQYSQLVFIKRGAEARKGCMRADFSFGGGEGTPCFAVLGWELCTEWPCLPSSSPNTQGCAGLACCRHTITLVERKHK